MSTERPLIACLGASSFLFRGSEGALSRIGRVAKISHAELTAALEGGHWPESIAEASFVINFAWDPKHPALTADIAAALPDECQAALVMLSSRSAYGNSGQTLLDEHAILSPTSNYGRAKVASETNTARACERTGRSLYTLRLANVFGFEFPASRGTFMSTMLHSLHERAEIVLHGDPNRVKDVLPLKSFTAMLAAFLKGAPQAGVYNIGSGIGVALDEIAKAVIDGFGSGSVRVDEQEPCSDTAFVFDVTRLRAVIGGEPFNALTTVNLHNQLAACGTMLRDYCAKHGLTQSKLA